MPKKPELPNLSREECFAFLRAIEEGSVTLSPEHEPQSVFCGQVYYRASNGWQIAVFNDCNEWDYVEAIIADDGRESDAMFDMEEPFYRPAPGVPWRRYGIPGDGSHRCTRCAAKLLAGPPFEPPFVCAACSCREKP